MRHFLLVVAAIVISLVSLKFLPAPYIWISVWWFLVFLYATLSSRRSSIKAVWFNIGIIILAFGIFEAYLWIGRPILAAERLQAEYRFKLNYSKDSQYTKHDFLGWIPTGDNKVKIKEYYKNELIFDAIYTIDSQGLRTSSPDTGEDDIRSILFFGGSFVFGAGLNDTETMPYQVGLKTSGDYRIYNFGVNAYGPHQMLSALEHGFAENIIKGKPTYAIYEAILDHVRRATQGSINRVGGPKYALDKNGDIVYQGQFGGFKSIVPKNVRYQLNKSLILKKIVRWQRSTNRDDIDLFIGVVDRSKGLLENLYPGIKFHLLFWDDDSPQLGEQYAPEMEEIIQGLKGKGVTVHLISDILSVDVEKKWLDYKISYLDGHPNAKANELIAEYLVKEVIIE